MKNNMSLLQHIKALKTAIPLPQKELEVQSKFSIFKTLKNLMKREGYVDKDGMFYNESFCFPFLDLENDPKKVSINAIIRGVFEQGGQIIEFHQKMRQQYSRFVVISQKSDLQMVLKNLKGLVKFQKIIRYQYVIESLNKFKRMNLEEYILYNNLEQLNSQTTSMELARTMLQQEELDQKLIRPKLSQMKEHKKMANKQQQSEQMILCKQMHTSNNQYPHETKIQNQENLEDQNINEQQYRQQSIDNLNDTQSYDSNEEEGNNQINELENEREQKKEQAYHTNSQVQQTKIKSKQANQKNKSRLIQKYKRNTLYRESKQKQIEKSVKRQQKPTESTQQAQFNWQNKKDRRQVWYAPPKNLASHQFAYNNYICDKLRQFHQIYSHIIYDTRKFTYIRSIAIIKSHHKQIKSVEDLKQVKDLSKSIYDKIKELLETGHISKLEKFARKDQIKICQQLQKVWGVGTKRAKQFYDMGIRTVQDLRKRPDLITKNMMVGLKYFQQFSIRIPRQKVTRMFELIRKIFKEQVLSDKMHHIQVAGSYRRGKATCGDIDVLICRHDGSIEENLIKNFVRELEQQKFITQSLSQPRSFNGRNNSAYMGVCFYQGQHHRIDIKHYPVEQYAFALMYFTGSDIFNRQMRMAAHNKGLILSDHGLAKKERNGMNKIYKGGSLPILKTEQEIFRFLDLDFCTPAQREI